VINLLANGNDAEKKLAENTRNAVIEAYRQWENP
jgi:hypothetical protein